MSQTGPGRIVYGPDWPDPADVVEFLDQVRQFVRAAIADGRSFQPQRALVLLIDDRDGDYQLADVFHNAGCADAIAAMRVSSRRCERSLDPDGVFDPEA